MLSLQVLLACALGAAPSATESDEPAAKPIVCTTFHPTTWMAQRIGGELIEVVCPLPDDADPRMWHPSRAVMATYQSAALVITNDARFETWVALADLPMRTTVRTAAAFKDEWIELEDEYTHSHGDDGEHSHKEIDGHTWVDPVLAKRQAEAVLRGLQRILPEQKDALQARFDQVAQDLDALDRAFRDIGALAPGEALVASHPAYNYLARRYGWKIVNLHLEPDEMPSAQALKDARAQLDAAGHRYRAILWEQQPAPEVAAAVHAALGVEGVLFSPCEMLSAKQRAAGVDYVKVMQDNAKRLGAALAREAE